MKKHILLYVVILLTIFSCKKDDNDTNPIYGKWTVTSGGNTILYGATLQYIIIEPDNTFYFLFEYNYKMRGYTKGLCQVINNQISFFRDFFFELYNTEFSGGELTLSNPDIEIVCEKSGNEPTKEEWVTTAFALETLVAPNQNRSDLAFDGEYLWYGGRKYGSETQLYKIDPSTASVVDSVDISSNSPIALEWQNDNLWVSSNGSDRIYKVDTATGFNIFTSAKMGAWIYGIGYDGEDLWCSSNNENSIYSYDPDFNIVNNTYELGSQPGGITYANGYLYICSNGIINKFDVDPFHAIGAYDIESGEIIGITYDGDDFWISVYLENETQRYKIYKISW